MAFGSGEPEPPVTRIVSCFALPHCKQFSVQLSDAGFHRLSGAAAVFLLSGKIEVVLRKRSAYRRCVSLIKHIQIA